MRKKKIRQNCFSRNEIKRLKTIKNQQHFKISKQASYMNLKYINGPIEVYKSLQISIEDDGDAAPVWPSEQNKKIPCACTDVKGCHLSRSMGLVVPAGIVSYSGEQSKANRFFGTLVLLAPISTARTLLVCHWLYSSNFYFF